MGIVAGKSGLDGWRVDIGSAHFAILDGLAFEGASKRNKANLKVCKVSFCIDNTLIMYIGQFFGLCTRLTGS